jgi:hypothetical protein
VRVALMCQLILFGPASTPGLTPGVASRLAFSRQTCDRVTAGNRIAFVTDQSLLSSGSGPQTASISFRCTCIACLCLRLSPDASTLLCFRSFIHDRLLQAFVKPGAWLLLSDVLALAPDAAQPPTLTCDEWTEVALTHGTSLRV